MTLPPNRRHGRRTGRTAAPLAVPPQTASPADTDAPAEDATPAAPILPAGVAVGEQIAAAANQAVAAAGGSTAALRALADGPQRIIPAEITSTDAERLAELEAALEHAVTRAGVAIDLMKGWLDEQRGTVLREIHAHGLYKVKSTSFEQYVWDRWKMKRARAYQLMEAAPVLALMSAIADTPPAVSTATALVPVLKTHGADAVRDVLTQAHTTAKDTGTKVTTAAIKRVLRARGLTPGQTPSEELPGDGLGDDAALGEKANAKMAAAADAAERALALYEEALALGVPPADQARADADRARLTKAGRILAKQNRAPGT
ncbi:hypothetical protein [Streptomyces roseolus]|uniref:hypothetical protein n=1 Tax=Streptomyces roseolus TaxID=67358 RepID=UPI00378DA522